VEDTNHKLQKEINRGAAYLLVKLQKKKKTDEKMKR
jgi:hypothetical protein